MKNDAATASLWAHVEATARAMRTDHCGPYAWGEDDAAMRDAAADDLLGWADDCEARLGCDVENFRAALLAFITYRDDGDGLDSAAFAVALGEAFDYVDDGAAAGLVRDRIRKGADHARTAAARDATAAGWAAYEVWADVLARVEE